MSWWGKLVGGTVGFMRGGPLGALAGAVLGHQVDRQQGPPDDGVEDLDRRRSAFFTATFAVMGHLAKSDGQVSAAEITMANRVMDRLDLNPGMLAVARG